MMPCMLDSMQSTTCTTPQLPSPSNPELPHMLRELRGPCRAIPKHLRSRRATQRWLKRLLKLRAHDLNQLRLGLEERRIALLRQSGHQELDGPAGEAQDEALAHLEAFMSHLF